MAYAGSRSMNADLAEGMTDGKYKKVVQDRGNAEYTTYESREHLNDHWFGIHEVPVKVLPDAKHVRTPNTVGTPEADCY